MDDEQYSVLIDGFKELVKVFSIPLKAIFDRFIQMNDSISMPPETAGLLNKIQLELESICISPVAPDIQKANIIVSKYWMKALTWKITRKNNLLDDFVTTLCVKYPIELSEQFLGEIKEYTFESI